MEIRSKDGSVVTRIEVEGDSVLIYQDNLSGDDTDLNLVVIDQEEVSELRNALNMAFPQKRDFT